MAHPRYTETCNRCGAGRLKWGKHNGGWRLFERSPTGKPELHECHQTRYMDAYADQCRDARAPANEMFERCGKLPTHYVSHYCLEWEMLNMPPQEITP